ncbi:MFS transporter [Rhizoctonia solani AG-3 Rhs1AP]|uniref:MFS transporter n=1 Tax=Rhizoctonia solani AG-3 Rhs1AP TaxID=1086054 RepID=X8JJ76_9AGAM|nr:MFS transporter [Rhizoctonia solani AG-3 Rhs1AP]
MPSSMKTDYEGDAITSMNIVPLAQEGTLSPSPSDLEKPIVGEVELQALERRLVRKLDLIFLPWACISQVMKKIDQNNYKAAYTAGMRDDLGLAGTNALTLLDIYFTIPLTVFAVPTMLVITRVRPSYFLPGLELIWGILTALMATCRKVEQMYPLRFFIGTMEACCWPLTTTILLSWYTPKELAKRQSIYLCSSFVGQMFTFAMQSAIHQTLEGNLGMEGWRWLFIINGIMTTVVAIIGFFALPDYPAASRAFYLTEQEKQLGYDRLLRYGRRTLKSMDEYPGWQGVKTLFRKTSKTIFGWKFPLLFLCYGPWAWATQVNSWFNLFLDDLRNADGTKMFSVKQVTEIPIAGSGLALVGALMIGWISDRYQLRWQLAIAVNLILLCCAIVLAIWPEIVWLLFLAFLVSYVTFANESIYVSWLGDICKDDPVERSLVLALALSFTMAGNSSLPIILWPSKEAPHYRYGYKVACGFCVASMISTVVYHYLIRRNERRKREESHQVNQETSQDEK